VRDSLRDRVTHRAAVLSLEESRKSIQMADSLKTLIQLAFIFVPLTFGTSVFGANLRLFGSRNVPL
jgi:Mg2+ and Co2+ transporter CorA